MTLYYIEDLPKRFDSEEIYSAIDFTIKKIWLLKRVSNQEERILQDIPSLVCVIDTAGNVKYTNKAFNETVLEG